MSQDATNLTTALRGSSKKQGDWGETQLEQLLQNIGLEEGTHYRKQVSTANEDGKTQRPDFVVFLPDDKIIIIDAKVSLNNYVNYISSEDEAEKERFTDRFLDNVTHHIKSLGKNEYQKLYPGKTLDYVIMFFPIDPAFQLVVELFYAKHKKNIAEEALSNGHIALCNTLILIPVLRLITLMWKQDKQQKNTRDIADRAGRMYDKLVGFTDDMIKVGMQFDTAKTTYNSAMNKLSEGRGNLIGQAEKMKRLGISTQKSINEKLADRATSTDTENTLGT